MNTSMVKRLILKDWYLNRWMILACFPAGVLSLGIIAAGRGQGIALISGIILLVTITIGIGVVLAQSNIVMERRHQTLPFVMCLPISYREYTTAKILGTLLIFLVPWLALLLGCIGLIFLTPGMPHGLIPYVAIMTTQMLTSTCLVIAVAVTTESTAWTTVVAQVSGLAFNVVGYSVAHIAVIAKEMASPSFQWSTEASLVLLAEFALIALMLGASFVIQARKKDFL
jgi:ABC-type Na+ efflux pump permease subunit